MHNDDRLHFLHWLIDRNDNFRLSYGTRAALIISSNAIVLTAIVFLLGKMTDTKTLNCSSALNCSSIKALCVLSLISVVISMIYAILATISLRSSGTDKKHKRIYYHARNTLKNFRNLDELVIHFKNEPSDKLIDRGCHELWIIMKRLSSRMHRLRISIYFLLLSIALLSSNLLVVLSRI